MKHNTKRVLVIGAGPMGMAAGLGAAQRGFDVTVLERGEIGDALLRWGPTRFFSPLKMNIPTSFQPILDGSLPPLDALLTGAEMADRVLRPLAEREPLRGRVLTRHGVMAIGRRGLTKQDFAGHPMRAERPFRILASSPQGEQVFEADILLDATGGFMIPAPMGPGGLPARGEAAIEDRIIRDLGTMDLQRLNFVGKRILLAGHGHSAANALLVLGELAAANASTRITWAVRTPNRRPCTEVCDDALPERRSIVTRVNDLAENPPEFLTVERNAMIESLRKRGGAVDVTLTTGNSGTFDHIIALTGYRPDLSFLSELNLDLSPATEGTGNLYRAIANVTDCLSSPRVSLKDLQTGEPNFFMIGSKSYGRARTFLLRNGLVQLDTILNSL